MEPNIFDKIHDIDLKKTMEKSYIDYAMSVIASRALPDVRDGLKPVQKKRWNPDIFQHHRALQKPEKQKKQPWQQPELESVPFLNDVS